MGRNQKQREKREVYDRNVNVTHHCGKIWPREISDVLRLPFSWESNHSFQAREAVSGQGKTHLWSGTGVKISEENESFHVVGSYARMLEKK
jgi:hypothetical protein